MSRDRDVDRRVDELERGQDRMAEEIGQLRRELRALGVNIPELDPAAPGRTPLSEAALLASMRRRAAQARAKKRIGAGSGAVKEPETLQRLVEASEEGEEGDDDGDDPLP